MNIRKLKISEVDALVELCYAAGKETTCQQSNRLCDRRYIRSMLDESMTSSTISAFVIEDNSSILGIIIGKIVIAEQSKSMNIEYIATGREYRSTGVASVLLERLTCDARIAGCSLMTCTIESGNYIAQRFFIKSLYKQVNICFYTYEL